MPPKPGDILEVDVDRLAYGGQGVARVDDFVLFVRGALPGDRVQVRVTRRKRSFAEARVVELLEPSPLRVEAQCVHAGECGGCEWQVLDYEAQLRFKQEQVVESLAHIGTTPLPESVDDHAKPMAQLDALPDEDGAGASAADEPNGAVDDAHAGTAPGYVLEPIRGMADPWHYRNKMEYSFAEMDGRLVAGLHRRGSWREVVDTDECRLTPAPIEAARQAVVEACRELGLTAYEREAQEPRAGLLRHLVVRHGFASGDVIVNLFVARRFKQEAELAARVQATGSVTSLALTVNETPADAAVGGPPAMLFGPPFFRETLAGVPLHVPLAAFLQTNSVMCDELYQVALRFADLRPGDQAFDLYCGIGAITLLLAPHAVTVNAVEVQAEAIAAAKLNAVLNDIDNVRFHVGDVRKVLKEPPPPGRADVVVADPPRAGLSRKPLARAAALGARRFVYVSCNPTTLAGNAVELVGLGYRLTRVAPVDMFPHTHHIETVALFERDPGHVSPDQLQV